MRGRSGSVTASAVDGPPADRLVVPARSRGLG